MSPKQHYQNTEITVKTDTQLHITNNTISSNLQNCKMVFIAMVPSILNTLQWKSFPSSETTMVLANGKNNSHHWQTKHLNILRQNELLDLTKPQAEMNSTSHGVPTFYFFFSGYKSLPTLFSILSHCFWCLYFPPILSHCFWCLYFPRLFYATSRPQIHLGGLELM